MKLLFVCTGNICRSPTAEGVMRKLLDEAGLAGRVTVDSAGTHGYHVGEPPDPRAVRLAARRGYDLAGLRARQVSAADFAAFDRLLAMDRGHRRLLLRAAPEGLGARTALFLEAAGRDDLGADVPDPYYGGEAGFLHTFEMIEAGCRGLVEMLRRAPP